MQPLISPIDHESRHNSYRADDEPHVSEQTPLLRFPRPDVEPATSTTTTVVVSMLLIILISGVVIGVYLLIVQSDSENILPPVETPLQLVSASQWNYNGRPMLSSSPFKAHQVVVVQTDTEPCHSTDSCTQLLRNMQTYTTDGSLPYNFLVSSNGQTFEALGWWQPSQMFPQHPGAFVLAFIGNFTDAPPTPAQVDEAKNFFAESLSLQHLEPSYSIVGKSTKYTPKYLFKSLSSLPQWNRFESDSY
ncbi:peptidoglycan recognition protein 3 isoform X2 [Pectinophora gossypiella]|uniref:Peptidoglycan recognition protein family domain-containing protein n=1 Tax=Pectinophora gossypiella TaxID=13191 RepID=A0A1E1WEY6_PECGO|nr:peptidoglycan recognition protein 3 isoform X2 [Pectinophora gossypiella]